MLPAMNIQGNLYKDEDGSGEIGEKGKLFFVEKS
jgi:hypothetical protein